MNQQPDKLFRDKLRDHDALPSSNAWQRIAANLDEKHRQRKWFIRIAASVILAVAAGVFLLRNEAYQPEQNLATKESRQPDTVTRDSVSPAVKSPSTPDNTEKSTSDLPPAKQRVPEKPGEEKPDSRDTFNSPSQNQSTTPTAEPEETLMAQLEEKHDFVESPDSNTARPSQRVTIVFTAAEVNQNYLTEKKEEVHATPEAETPSGLQRILVAARELTIDQDPIGELRQKKDDILAKGLRKNKQDNQLN
jgi:hypothetical protein